MDLSLPNGDLAWLTVTLLAGGFITGILSGLLGVGGGGILVPILYALFAAIGVDDDIRMHLAVGTSLAIIIPTSLRSFYSHYRHGAVDMDVIRRLGPPVAAGVILGVIIASFVDSAFLKIVYVVAAGLLSLKLFAGGARWQFGTSLPGNPVNSLVGGFIGVISTLIGIGGGVFISSYLTMYGRFIHQAVATSSGFGVVIAVPATIGYMLAGWGMPELPPGSLGYVSMLGVAIVTPASVLAAPLGVRIGHGISRRKLEIVFGVFLMSVALRFLYDLTYG